MLEIWSYLPSLKLFYQNKSNNGKIIQIQLLDLKKITILHALLHKFINNYEIT
jgi:hypothetical protein